MNHYDTQRSYVPSERLLPMQPERAGSMPMQPERTGNMSSTASGSLKQRRSLNQGMTILPPDFTPSNYSVLCGRGKGYYNAVGNRRFRVMVGSYLQQYIDAQDKPHQKSSIIGDVVGIVKDACPVGSFIKPENGRYYELSDKAAREKCGALFRDCLHQASSTKEEKQPAQLKRASSHGSKGGQIIPASKRGAKPAATRRRTSECSFESISLTNIASFFDVDENRSVSMVGSNLHDTASLIRSF